MKKLRLFTVLLTTLCATASPVLCLAEGENSQVASASEMSSPLEISDEGMTPVTAEDLQEGVYSIDVECSSAMFPIDDCQLTVGDEEMTAQLTLGGQGYLMLYMGTGEEAVSASQEDYLSFELNEEGKQVYQVPVKALDQRIECASFSKRKQKWYDRTLLFKASSLPMEALKNQNAATVDTLELSDGEYTVDIVLDGGSGHTKVENPAKLLIKKGEAFLTLAFGNSNYDYVIVEDQTYRWSGEEKNSTFTFPIKAFDYKIPITADTTALGKPRELSYTLCLDSSSLEEMK